MAVSKEDFLKVWKDSSREDILNQYYYDYKFTRELCDKVNKAIEYIENNWIEYSDFQYVDNDDELNIDCESIKELLDILKGGNTNVKD